MDLVYIYVTIYALILLFSGILGYKLIRLLKEIDLLGFKLLLVSMAGLIVFSAISILDYFTEIVIVVGDKPLYIYDLAMVLSLSVTFLTFFYLVETVQKDRITWRMFLAFFFTGGAIASEILERSLLAHIVSAFFEVSAMLLLIYVIYDYAMELKPHVVNFKYYVIGLSGLVLLALSLITGVLSQLIYVSTKNVIYLIISELSSAIALVGLNLIIYPITLRPLSVFAILAKPKAFIILKSEGDPIYEYYFDRGLSSIERKNLRDLLVGVHITIKNMLEEDTYIKYIKTDRLSIIGSYYEKTVALFLTRRSTIMLNSLLKTLHKIFEKELSEALRGEDFKSINIENLGRFDHVVKYYLTQLAR